MKDIGFKHQRKNKQNSDKRHFIEINKLTIQFSPTREITYKTLAKI
jgi:hypothetical protein